MTIAPAEYKPHHPSVAAAPVGRSLELDGLRGIAIALVVIWHYFDVPLVESGNAGVQIAKGVLSLFWSGVDLFFVLSGFLITSILLRERDSPNYFPVFYLRRICRIFPLYFLHLTIGLLLFSSGGRDSAAFAWLFHDPLPWWSYATFTQNFFIGAQVTFHWLAITWSLAIEEQFYLLHPFIVRYTPRRLLGPIFLLGICGAYLCRALVAPMSAVVLAPCRIDTLLFGALLALSYSTPGHQPMYYRWRRSLVALALPSLSLLLILQSARHITLGNFLFPCLAGFYSLLVLFALHERNSFYGRILRARPLVFLGEISFAAYLFHQAINGLLHGGLLSSPPSISSPTSFAITCLAIPLTLVSATLSTRYYEARFIRLGHRFVYEKPVQRALT